MANSADPDETPHFAASHLGLRFFVNAPYLDLFMKSPQLHTFILGKLRPFLSAP